MLIAVELSSLIYDCRSHERSRVTSIGRLQPVPQHASFIFFMAGAGWKFVEYRCFTSRSRFPNALNKKNWSHNY